MYISLFSLILPFEGIYSYFQMCFCEEGYVFIGSKLTDSVLLQYNEQDAEMDTLVKINDVTAYSLERSDDINFVMN